MATPAKPKPTPQATHTTDPLKAGHNLRVKDLAPRLGMSTNTIWRLARQGKFPKPIKLSDKVTVWKADEVLDWLASKGAAG